MIQKHCCQMGSLDSNRSSTTALPSRSRNSGRTTSAGAAVLSVAIEDLPCLHCDTERGAEIRYRLGQVGGLDEAQRSPVSGLPVDCCRIRHGVPVFKAMPDLSAPRR